MGDISLGLEDIDERLANYILTEKINFDQNNDTSTSKLDILSVMSLISTIKDRIFKVGFARLNLIRMELIEDSSSSSTRSSSSDQTKFDPNSELRIDKDLVNRVVCNDIYEWSMIHIKRCLKELNMNIEHIDKVVFLIDDINLPGFVDFFKESFPNANLNLISMDEIGLGGLKMVCL